MTDLLRAAGMPLGLERQQLLQQSLAMQQQVRDAQEQLAQQAQVTPLRHAARQNYTPAHSLLTVDPPGSRTSMISHLRLMCARVHLMNGKIALQPLPS